VAFVVPSFSPSHEMRLLCFLQPLTLPVRGLVRSLFSFSFFFFSPLREPRNDCLSCFFPGFSCRLDPPTCPGPPFFFVPITKFALRVQLCLSAFPFFLICLSFLRPTLCLVPPGSDRTALPVPPLVFYDPPPSRADDRFPLPAKVHSPEKVPA